MHISLEVLKPTDCSFHGIVPGSANYPLGRIALNICFGNRQNYRREKLDFEVMDWPSQHHAILGRPAFSRFMAVPHYTYLVLKNSYPKIIRAKIYELISKNTTFACEILRTTGIRRNCKKLSVLREFILVCTDCAI
jgi:hypothetical protein